MGVFKCKETGTWYVMTRYRDWKGERKQKCKRGFATKRAAQDWEQKFHMQNAADMDMTFEAFYEIYTKDMKARLKENSWITKQNIVETKILPYFGQRKISEITTKDVIAWQNEQLAYRDEKHKPYSQTYLKTLYNQLSAIFNHAVRFYDLRANPASKSGNMGNVERREMLFWTKEEYQQFAAEMMDKPVSYYAFEMLYWCGIREGELLALTPADFDFQNSTVRINKSYQRLHGEDVITSPKTKKSNRTIKMPQFLCEEMQDYLGMLYGLKKKDRIFTVTKSYLHHEMDRGAKHGFKLSSLRFLKELNGKDITGVEEINPNFKDRILDFQIDIVEINQSQNPDFSPIDLFLRLNSKPFPIEANTFEMWNAYVTKEYVETIKGYAKEYSGKLFKPIDTRMKNEELITMLAYLAFIERKDQTKPGEYLNIFVRNQRINARFSTKGNITTRLGEISSINDPVFGEALKDVKSFIEKLQVLCGDEFQDFNKMLGHSRKNTQSRTNQNFYLLWIALAHIDYARVKQDKAEIFEKIRNLFLLSQDINDDEFDVKGFIQSLSSI